MAITAQTLTGAGSSITTAPESAKVSTVANLLAACVNTSGPNSTPCKMLLGSVAPSGSTAPVNTLEAAVHLSTNPTSNTAASPGNNSATDLATLYSLQTPTAPFVGVSTQPTDWTIGIQNIAVDSVGNVWVLSNNGGPGGLVQLGPTGTPLSNVSTLSEYGPFVSPIANPPVLSSPKSTTTTFTTQNTVVATSFGTAANNASINPRNLAIDPTLPPLLTTWWDRSSRRWTVLEMYGRPTINLPLQHLRPVPSLSSPALGLRYLQATAGARPWLRAIRMRVSTSALAPL